MRIEERDISSSKSPRDERVLLFRDNVQLEFAMKKTVFSLLLSLSVGQAFAALPAGPSEGGAPEATHFLRLPITPPGSTRLDILPAVRQLIPTLKGIDPSSMEKLGRRLDELKAAVPDETLSGLKSQGVETLDQLAAWRRGREKSGASFQELDRLDALNDAVTLAAPLDPHRGKNAERQWKDHERRVQKMIAALIRYAESLSKSEKGRTLEQLEKASALAGLVMRSHLYYAPILPPIHPADSAIDVRKAAHDAHSRISERLELARLAEREEREAAAAKKNRQPATKRESAVNDVPGGYATVNDLMERIGMTFQERQDFLNKKLKEPFFQKERRMPLREAKGLRDEIKIGMPLENPFKSEKLTFEGILLHMNQFDFRVDRTDYKRFANDLGSEWTVKSLVPLGETDGWIRFKTSSPKDPTFVVEVAIRVEAPVTMRVTSPSWSFTVVEELPETPLE